ncbi:unnamed protein product [Microthlaspi erraticum]|uniref:Uncharacterized protein n=1 Tax=Microthlaspi erraticum TaxID=1685480 RepID=A0A6D2K5P4_9BRAS|nr:unnamed protein product [Microthlaspi erraticum]
MDFIKTSSLRALIELTFQRNWNGLIWMSRKGVTKRVETVQTALSRISAQPRSPAGRGTHVPRSAKTVSVRLKSRPNVQSRAQLVSRTAHEHSVRPGELRLASGRDISSAKPISTRPRRPTVNPSDPDRSDSATTRLSGRSSRPTVPTPRSTRSPF